MAELTPSARLVALLGHIAERRVLTNEHDNQVYLDIPGDPPALVSRDADAMKDAGWCREPADNLAWELTDLGRAVRAEWLADEFVGGLLDPGEGLLT